tara:strand:+ start:74 stop:529 length:456 start_codon:yes stop_codon:yes gene_type:complete
MTAAEIMKQAYSENYQGSITELIMQAEAAEMQEQQAVAQEMEVANTPEQQQVGLTNGSTKPMGFPLEPGANNQFNTVGVPGNIKMTEYANGNPIDSSQILEPGLVGINTHPQTDFVLEEPMYAKTGGAFEKPLKDLSFSEKIERYRKSKKK